MRKPPPCFFLALGLLASACGGNGDADALPPALDHDAAGTSPDSEPAADGDSIDGDSADRLDDGASDSLLDGGGGEGQIEVGPDTPAGNQPPVAVISPLGAVSGLTIDPGGYLSYDPDLGDAVASYDWTIDIDGEVFHSSSESAGQYLVPCHANSVTITLVVKDMHGLASAPATLTLAVEHRTRALVSISKCDPGNECGSERLPWCTITGAYEHRFAIGPGYPIEVEAGRYEQGATGAGGKPFDTPETLAWQAPDPAAEFALSVIARSKIGPGGQDIKTATCDGWEGQPAGVAVVVHEPAGWSVQHAFSLTLQGICVISQPTSPPNISFTAMWLQGRTILNSMVVRTDTVPAPFPWRTTAIMVPGASDYEYFEMGGSRIIVGSAGDEAGGIDVSYLTSDSLNLGQDEVSFADGATAPSTFGIRAVECQGASIADGAVSGGPGSDRSVALEARKLSMELKVDDSHLFGAGSGENVGVLVDGPTEVTIRASDIEGRAASPQPITVDSAVAVHVVRASRVAVEVTGAITGAAEGVTASDAAIGLRVDKVQANTDLGRIEIVHHDTGGGFLGGTSLRRSLGIQIDGPAFVLIADVERITGGRAGDSTALASEPPVAAGIVLGGAGGTADLRDIALMQGCYPDCLDYGVPLVAPVVPDDPAVLGVGLLVDADPASIGAWDATLQGQTLLLGGAIQMNTPGASPTSELAGILARGGNNGGHSLHAWDNVTIEGTLPGATGQPLRSEGVRLERSSLLVDGPVQIAGGAARETARGVWLRNAFPTGQTPPASGAALEARGTESAPFVISGNPSVDPLLRPAHVFGIQDEVAPSPRHRESSQAIRRAARHRRPMVDGRRRLGSPGQVR